MGKKPTKPTEKKPTKPTALEALNKEAEGPKAEADGSIKFVAREVKNVYTSEECLLDKESKVSEAAVNVLVELCKNSNVYIFVVKTAKQRSDSHALKPEIRDTAKGALEKYAGEKKLNLRFIPVPAESNPVDMKVKYIANVIETATFPIWVVEKKGPSADKDVILSLQKTSNWSLVQNEPGSTSKDGTIVKVFGITSADDWSTVVVPADKEDKREVVAEKEKPGDNTESQ